MITLPNSITAVLRSILGDAGHSDQSLRQTAADYAAAAGGANRQPDELPDAVKSFIEKVTHHPYKVVDRDIETLKSAGFTEDEIFEITVAVAVGSGVGRIEKTLSRKILHPSGKCSWQWFFLFGRPLIFFLAPRLAFVPVPSP